MTAPLVGAAINDDIAGPNALKVITVKLPFLLCQDSNSSSAGLLIELRQLSPNRGLRCCLAGHFLGFFI
jgi:hypothetical protein